LYPRNEIEAVGPALDAREANAVAVLGADAEQLLAIRDLAIVLVDERVSTILGVKDATEMRIVVPTQVTHEPGIPGGRPRTDRLICGEPRRTTERSR
jgi:hypothetical protein